MEGLRRALVAVAAGLALADASIVSLALPPILTEMDTTITGVAAVIGVYAFVLALSIWPASRLRVGPSGFGLFALASLGCAIAGSLEVLLAFRALQAVGGAAALIAAFSVLDAGASRSGRRLWLGAALIGTAAGPAIGGVLTELFDWRAIFIVQAPIAAAAAIACVQRAPRMAVAGPGAVATGRREEDARTRPPRGDAVPPAAANPPDGGLWARGEAARATDRRRRRSRDAEPLDAPAPFRDLAAPAHDAAAPDRGDTAPARDDAAPYRGDTASARDDAADTAPPRADAPPAQGGAAPARGEDSSRVIGVDSGDARPHAAALLRPAGAAGSGVWLAALAFTAAAFTAVLFLLVLELVAGFAMSPIEAALGVLVLPLAALAGAAIPGAPRSKALAGALLIAGGAAALAFLPGASIAWTIVPQILAGTGIGLSLPAFSNESDTSEAARNLLARHVGIVVVLAILAPVATAKLETTTDQAILQGAALVLDAQLDPLQKLELAPALLDKVDVESPRAGLTRSVEAKRAQFADNPAVYDRLAGRLDDVVVVAVQDAFRTAYLIAAGLSLLAAVLLVSAYRRPAIAFAAAAAAATFLVFVVARDRDAPASVALQDPCLQRDLPDTGGIAGAIQTEALRLLDRAACETGTSREEFALALFDPERAKTFEREHGVNPRTASGLLSLLGG